MPRTSARPSSIRAASHCARSCSGSATSSPATTRGRAPRVGEQEQREQAARLALVGHQPHEQAGEPDRLLAQVSAHRRLAVVAVWPSV